jgi:hypothetical protein
MAWKVRETRRIGVKTLFEVYKTTPNGETIVRGRWMYRKEAEQLADKLNEEEGYHECLC